LRHDLINNCTGACQGITHSAHRAQNVKELLGTGLPHYSRMTVAYEEIVTTLIAKEFTNRKTTETYSFDSFWFITRIFFACFEDTLTFPAHPRHPKEKNKTNEPKLHPTINIWLGSKSAEGRWQMWVGNEAFMKSEYGIRR
jgi:hypothetical protein